jgi:predicted dinucleotide-binding enzyme
MKIGVLGTGMVGTTLASKLVALGHEVKLGARDAGNPKASAWASKAGKGASQGTLADAARFGEIVFNCTLGTATLEALRAAGKENLKGKVLVDVSNPMESAGGALRLTTPPGTSQGEQVQKEFPEAKVVKALNTVNANVMVAPERVGGESDVFIAGDDAGAKEKVTALLRDFGWKRVHDLGGIAAARGMEAYLLFWVAVAAGLKTYDFNVRVVKPS